MDITFMRPQPVKLGLLLLEERPKTGRSNAALQSMAWPEQRQQFKHVEGR